MHSSTQESSEDQSSRHATLSRLMEPAARDRLTRIALVNSNRARDVENILLRKAQEGLLQQKVSESNLISLLNQLKDEKKETKIIFNRQAFDED